ncbi:MAG: hypothetical protein WD556_13300 [Actinomycetota bacterium]
MSSTPQPPADASLPPAPPGNEPTTPGPPQGRAALVVVGAVLGAAAVGVVVLLLAGGNEDPVAAPLGPPRSLTAEGAKCLPPECDAVSAQVELAWAAPLEGVASEYRVARGEEDLLRDDPAETAHVDTNLPPGRSLVYTVRAIGAAGQAGPPAEVEVVTPRLSLRDASVQGTYDVTLTVTRSTGLARFLGIKDPLPGRREQVRWPLHHDCSGGVGRCEISLFPPDVLRQHGTTYEGTTRSEANCTRGTTAQATEEIRLRVTQAATHRGEWRATAFTGEIQVDFDCGGFGPASSGAADVLGRLPRR